MCLTCSNESPVPNPGMGGAGESYFPTGKKLSCVKALRVWGGEEQAACSPSHFQKEENQFGYGSSRAVAH